MKNQDNPTPNQDTLEIEMRFKADEDMKEKLMFLGAKVTNKLHQIDTYFKHSKDKNRDLLIRIRREGDQSKLTFKGSTKDKEDIAWPEWENEIQNPDALEQLFLTNGIIKLCTINKKRTSYNYNNLEINYDVISELGTFVEVEIQTKDLEHGKAELLDFITNDLEIDSTKIIKQGYVPMLLNK